MKTIGGLGMKTDYSKVEAGAVFFAIWHEQWDANIHHHADQGVIIQVRSGNQDNEINLLQFNCFFLQPTSHLDFAIFFASNLVVAVTNPNSCFSCIQVGL